MNSFKFILILIIISGISIFTFSQDKGIIQGRVFNAINNSPVEFATVTIFGTTIGSISDLNGEFLFTGIKPGFVEIRVSSVGYEPYISAPVLVTNANKVFIDIPMVEAKVKLDEITIKASPFRRIVESPVSLRRIDIRDIEKNPGGNRDISKILQSYPGVASTPSFRNDIIVRGGGASENRFYLDGVEIPNINHFATQGASGGPVGIINVDFIREVNFLSGAFPADKGNALSSIIDFRLIDGNSDKLKFKGSIGASDLALTLDGPLSQNTTYIVSARRSYLQFLFSLIGLPFLPTYNDFQLKTKTKINDKNELTLIGIGAIDQFALNLKANETEQQQFILGYLAVNEQWNYAVGAVWKHYGENGFGTWVLSRNFLNNKAYKYQDNNEVDSLLILDYKSDEIENKFRYERSNNYSNGINLTYGTGGEYVKYNNFTFRKIFVNDFPQVLSYNTRMELFKWSLFSQVSQDFLEDRLTLSFGIRADANNYSREMSNLLDQLSPRLSASYLLSQDFFLNFNTGIYYQTPSYTTLGYKDLSGEMVNKKNGLKYIRSDHIVAGIEWLADQNSRLTVEGFFKFYRNYPFSSSDSISLSSKGADFGVFGDEEVTSTGINRSYGMEILYRNRNILGSNLNLSYTLVRSETQSFRSDIADGAKWLPTAWDNRHILNITTTREFRNNWRAGFKWRFVGGTPYTPYDIGLSSLIQAWDVRNQGYPDYSRFNSERLRSFHQLDLRLDKEWFLNKFTLNLYLDVQNVYNFKAEEQKLLTLDNTMPQPNAVDPLRYNLKELELEAGTVLPTIGVIIEF